MESSASVSLTPAISLPWAQEAYTEYLRSIHYISQVLLEEVEATKGTALSLATPMLGKLDSPALGVSQACRCPVSHPLGH